jgi:uncharacterized damage-inducible protein DinB
MLTRIPRPQSGEYLAYYDRYIALVTHEADAVTALMRQVPSINQLGRLTPEQAAFRYADGKWSVRQVVGHVTDAERIFSYRLLRAVRGDRTPLASFDENSYAETSNFDTRSMENVAGEFAAVRHATLALLGSLDPSRLEYRTVAADNEVSVRALAFIIAGHTVHHLNILRERYGIDVS